MNLTSKSTDLSSHKVCVTNIHTCAHLWPYFRHVPNELVPHKCLLFESKSLWASKHDLQLHSLSNWQFIWRSVSSSGLRLRPGHHHSFIHSWKVLSKWCSEERRSTGVAYVYCLRKWSVRVQIDSSSWLSDGKLWHAACLHRCLCPRKGRCRAGSSSSLQVQPTTKSSLWRDAPGGKLAFIWTHLLKLTQKCKRSSECPKCHPSQAFVWITEDQRDPFSSMKASSLTWPTIQ